MTATNHTEHYELSQYTEGDRPDRQGIGHAIFGRI